MKKTWEDINILILESLYINVYLRSNGSHLSGMDICCSFGKLSNKSSKYINNKKFSISSYRLTKVCNSKNIGDIKNIINEINKRKNFDYYSVIVRDEKNTKTIEYDWYLIPSDYYILNPETYEWKPMLNTNNIQTGWTTKEIDGCKMSISFSMSSQLWIHINTDTIKKFIVSTAISDNTPKINYINISDILTISKKIE